MIITYFFRKTTSNISIERYFADIISNLPSFIKAKKIIAPFYGGKNLFTVFLNSLWASLNESKINHITGDIHYISLLLPKKNTVLSIMDCYPLRNNKGLKFLIIKKLWYSIPCHRATIITVISEATKRELLEYIKIDPKRIFVIPVCISKDFMFKNKNINIEKPRFLQVGTRENKNLENHIKAIKDLICHLRIIGKISEDQRELLNKYSIDFSNVESISDSQLVEEFEASDMLLFASTYEGFGMPIVEAQAVGIPVVTSKISPMFDVAGTGAFFVDPDDVESIRNAILLILKDKLLRDDLIKKGYLNSKKYTPEVVVQEYMNVYNLIDSNHYNV